MPTPYIIRVRDLDAKPYPKLTRNESIYYPFEQAKDIFRQNETLI